MAASCVDTAWNPVSASSPLSALAGLISGFVFAGMIVLLVERHQQKMAAARIPALIQFLAAFVGLGLNSYMFGLIAGENVQACRRIWTATAISSGMLAAGTVAAVGGVVLLVQAYLAGQQRATGTGTDTRTVDGPIGTDDTDGTPVGSGRLGQYDMLTKLLRGAFLLVSWMATLLLLARTGEALWVWLGKDLASVVPVLLAGVLVTLFGAIALFAWRPGRRRPPDDLESAHCRELYLGATATVLYSIIGTVVVGALLSVVNGDWSKADGWTAWLIVLPGFVVPAVAIGLYVRGVQGLIRSWYTIRSRPPVG